MKPLKSEKHILLLTTEIQMLNKKNEIHFGIQNLVKAMRNLLGD